MTLMFIIKTMLIITSIWPRFFLSAFTNSLVQDNSELSGYLDAVQQLSDISSGSRDGGYVERWH